MKANKVSFDFTGGFAFGAAARLAAPLSDPLALIGVLFVASSIACVCYVMFEFYNHGKCKNSTIATIAGSFVGFCVA